jgi:hypothetical protein
MSFGELLTRHSADKAVVGRKYFFCNFITALRFFQNTGVRYGREMPRQGVLTAVDANKLFAFRSGEECWCYALEILDEEEKNGTEEG